MLPVKKNSVYFYKDQHLKTSWITIVDEVYNNSNDVSTTVWAFDNMTNNNWVKVTDHWRISLLDLVNYTEVNWTPKYPVLCGDRKLQIPVILSKGSPLMDDYDLIRDFSNQEAKICTHKWSKYIGFTDVYDYCTQCDEKKREIK